MPYPFTKILALRQDIAMARFVKESLETLRQRIDLVDVLSSHVDMKRAGSAYKACCPFHEEKTPSFIIQKGDTHYHCYGCGAHGDAIQFLMNYLKLSFTEAVESLAEKFNVPIMKTAQEEEKGVGKALLREALDVAAEFFHCCLLHAEEGKCALEYLNKRGLNLDFIRRFELGLAPQTASVFRKVVRAKNIAEQTLFEAGLIGERKTLFFRDRITFPIRNPAGSVVGFSARKYREETFGGKYINTPETPLFKKSRLLYGLNYCRRRIVKEKRAILVEGQIDCLRMIEAGLNLTVATLGTALGENHVIELENLGVQKVCLLFDADDAGVAAVSKAGNLFQKRGIEVVVVTLPKGSDPDTFLANNGSEKLIALIKEGTDYLTFQVHYLSKELNPDTPAGKNALVSSLTKQIKGWEEPVMIHESLRKLASLTQLPEEIVGAGGVVSYASSSSSKETVQFDPNRVLELDLLRWLVLSGEENGQFIHIAKAHLKAHNFWVPTCRKIYESYLQENHQDLLSLLIDVNEDEAQSIIDEIMRKKINKERGIQQFSATVQKLLDRQWMLACEEIKRKIHSGNHTDDEVLTLAKEFDTLKKKRPKVAADNLL